MASESSPRSTGRLTRFQIGAGHTALSLILGARALVNGLFALWLWTAAPGRPAFFSGAATYLAADGILALLAFGVLAFGVIVEAPRLLTGATASDGALRILAAIALRVFPGLPDFPVTAVAFFGMIGSCAACLAIAAMTMRIGVWRSRHHAHERTPLALHEELDPIFIAGAVALVFIGYAFLKGPPINAAEYRTLGIQWATMLALAFGMSAVGVLANRGPTVG
jgi:hypothetical protein